MKQTFLYLSLVLFPLIGHAQSPQITSINRCINSNPDCNGAVNNPGEIAIRWTTDPSSGSSDPVTRVYLHGPFNTTEGTTPDCTGIGQGWDEQWQVYRAVDGTLCNFDDGTCLLPTPADGSSDPLSGMREPHCRLNLCGNGGEGFDREVCSSAPSDGTKAILVDGARESGSYFLVFEKESGAVEIATQHYDPLPPDCGVITAEVSETSPQADFVVNPQNATRVCVSGDETVCQDVSGAGSVPISYPLHRKEESVTVTCEGAGPAAVKAFSIRLGNLDVSGALSLEAGGCPPNDVCDLALTYRVHRTSTVQEMVMQIDPDMTMAMADLPGDRSQKGFEKRFNGSKMKKVQHDIRDHIQKGFNWWRMAFQKIARTAKAGPDRIRKIDQKTVIQRKDSRRQVFKFEMAPHFVPWVKTISIQGIFSGPGNVGAAPYVLMSPVRVRRANQASGTFTVPRSHYLYTYELVVCDFDDRCFTQRVEVPFPTDQVPDNSPPDQCDDPNSQQCGGFDDPPAED